MANIKNFCFFQISWGIFHREVLGSFVKSLFLVRSIVKKNEQKMKFFERLLRRSFLSPRSDKQHITAHGKKTKHHPLSPRMKRNEMECNVAVS